LLVLVCFTFFFCFLIVEILYIRDCTEQAIDNDMKYACFSKKK